MSICREQKVLALLRATVHSAHMLLDENDVLATLRLGCDEAESIYAWAKKHSLSFSYVAEVLRGVPWR